MAGQVDYKNKYVELRSKYLTDMDVAFRLGFEQGAQQAQVQQAQDQQMQQQAMDQAAMGQQPGQPGQEQAQPGQEGQPQDPMAQGGSELDQHISQLEGMLGSNATPEIKKSLEGLKAIRKSQLFNYELQKSENAIKGISKALHKPQYKIGVQASQNMTSNAKAAVSMQHKIVGDIMKSWSEQEGKASSDIKNILSVEGLINKE